jgi:hypothetical protein
MPTITITKLYDLVSVKLGRETAENLTTFIEEKIKGEVETKTSILATKEDVANSKAELARDIGDSKAEMIKWMFIFWVGQVITTFGFILLFLKK